MHSGPSKDGLPIPGVTGYHTWRLTDKNDKFGIFCTMYTQSSKYEYKNAVISYIHKALTKSASSYGLSMLSNLEDEEPFSHVSVDTLSPKITGILSVMTVQ
jgi:hypothetical protein